MKQLVEVTDNVGLDSLLGENVLLICTAYFYTGKLAGVNDTFVMLENPAIVYETGKWDSENYADVQTLHVKKFFVQRQAIESFGLSK